MKEIYGPASYDTESSNPEVIAYLVKDVDDVLELINKTKRWADMGEFDDVEVLNEHLVEFGVRPSGEPVIAVVRANDEYNSLRFTYISKDMFEV